MIPDSTRQKSMEKFERGLFPKVDNRELMKKKGEKIHY